MLLSISFVNSACITFAMLKIIISVVLLILPVISCWSRSQMVSFRPDYTFDAPAGGWLKFHRMPLTWEDAVLTCFYEDATLASPLNHELGEALSIQMQDCDVTGAMFTGISNIYSNSVYQSMEGIPISEILISWSSVPHRQASKNCLIMNPNGTVSEASCGDRHPFTCYKKNDLIQPNSCGTLDEDYKLNSRTGSCYKLHKEKHTWSEAYRICVGEGGHLAIVNSQSEAEVIWNLGKYSGSNYALAIGFHEWGRERDWMTIQGQSLKDAGYDKWYTGEPNIVTEVCGGFMFDGPPTEVGILADLPCDVKVMFICEIDP